MEEKCATLCGILSLSTTITGFILTLNSLSVWDLRLAVASSSAGVQATSVAANCSCCRVGKSSV